MNAAEVIDESISPWNQYCDGFGSSGSSGRGYVCAVTLKTGKFPLKFGHPGSRMLDDKNAFDVAETDGAYIGQINMVVASSFCGPMGRIWGHTFPLMPLLRERGNKLFDFDGVPAYDAKPLIEASQALFGTTLVRHFPFMPGSQVPCAMATIERAGPAEIYATIGIAVVEDESKERAATLFMEDAGCLEWDLDGKLSRTPIDVVQQRIGRAMLQVGENQHVRYKELFISTKSARVNKGEVGSALVAVPYLKLARYAVPGRKAEALERMTLDEWKSKVRSKFLDGAPE